MDAQIEAQSLTDFSIVGAGTSSVEEYVGVTNVSEATSQGAYQPNRGGLKKPFVLRRYTPPLIKVF
jgi:hypothetical protein